MASVWLCAIMIAVGGMAGLLRIAHEPEHEPDSWPPNWLQQQPFGVIIGTSLVFHAFPAEYPANDIFSVAKTHDRIIRVRMNDLSDLEALKPVRRAVDVGVKAIFVEIDPFLRDFHIDYELDARLRAVRDFSIRLRGAALQWLRPPPVITNGGVMIDSPGDKIYDGNIHGFADKYPLYVHAPHDSSGIAETLAIGRRQGLNIVWVAMPRSQTAVSYLGPTFETAFTSQLQAFAAAFNATVWRPAIFWPNEFFVDDAHMNAAGRARFISELRRYVATRQ